MKTQVIFDTLDMQITVVGYVVPRQDCEMLQEVGVKGIFGLGAPAPASARDVLQQIQKSLGS